MNFAVIQNDKVIALIGIFPTNWQQFQEVVIAHSGVQEGDDYVLGHFYRNGELVLPDTETALGIITGEIEVTSQ